MKQQLLFAFKFFTLAGVYLFTRSRTPANKLRNPEKSIAVLIILENLKRVLLYNGRLILNAKNQVEMLEDDVRLFKAFLKDSAKVHHKDGPLEELVRQIQDLVPKAEKTIEVFLNLAADNRARNFVQRAFGGSMELIRVAKEIRANREKVRIIYDKIRVICATRRIRGAAPEEATAAEKKACLF
ncbi:hypothetical protein CDL12_00195 [Handroanthus impetiginosus]|uniref:Disease resistance N-terminal domain-containing protein n=1 Tax=Handroanthus impetiginosus TaxID=429701 RepID=A0A2G9IBA3_9LAMI|nr:hypothetical protein CDL12_00195 [Handroanthus impetiginosus]